MSFFGFGIFAHPFITSLVSQVVVYGRHECDRDVLSNWCASTWGDSPYVYSMYFLKFIMVFYDGVLPFH